MPIAVTLKNWDDLKAHAERLEASLRWYEEVFLNGGYAEQEDIPHIDEAHAALAAFAAFMGR